MKYRNYKRSILISTVVILFASAMSYGQADSLVLKDVINTVVSTHPTVKAAQEAINNAEARIGLARTGYYPESDVTASVSNIGPVIKLTIPDMGSFQLYPNVNYSASINYRQVIYDFGRTKENIEIETEAKALGEQALEQVKQKLSLYALNNYYTILFLQAAIKIKEEQIATLTEHLRQVEKMMATGSATEYQVLTTKVRISGAETQKTDLLASLAAQQAALNSLLGSDRNAKPVVKNELTAQLPVVASDSVVSYAYRNRDEMLINQKKEALAELKYDMIRLQNKPLLSLQASGGAKNGYIPHLNELRANYVVGVGLRIPIYDGNKTKYNLQQAKSAITSLGYETETAKRTISNEVMEAEAYLEAAEKKVGQSELQLQQAAKANSLAETSFKSGIITNLDLLDANTAVSESKLMLLKARIDYVASIYRLKAAMGERVY